MQPEVIDDRPQRNQPQLIASRLHLAVFLWIQLAMAASGGTVLRQIIAVTDPDTFHFRLACYYLLILVWEWVLLCFVWFGVRKSGTSLQTLIGGRWTSVWDFAKDVGIGLAFWLLWMIALIGFAQLSGPRFQTSGAARAMLPSTGPEFTLWIAMSLSAGFCEEVMYRGYLQRQFLAMSKNLPVAIIAQAVLFGVVHSYQGPIAVVAISIMGVLFGLLAAWRRSLRPGMLAHAWYDGFVGAVMYLMHLLHQTQ